jgi:hypothetical protein
MNYWLNLFTPTTWNEFRTAGAAVAGFREHNLKRAEKIQVGDIFLCYLVGAKRWVGLLEVVSDRYYEETPIWSEEVFPVRFKVKPALMLDADNGVPIKELEGKLSFYPQGSKTWSGLVRGSPTKYKKQDGDLISESLKAAREYPVHRPVDPKHFRRSSNLYKLNRNGKRGNETVVSVPPAELDDEIEASSISGSTHTEIQWRLLDLGSRLGLKVWAPKSDRSRGWRGGRIGEVPSLLDSIPTQFDEVTNRTIENIDVIWLSGNAIVAAFEVEHSTSIYSGLLRMSDLLTMQPNIDIKLYLVAPDERYTKFKNEVARATFASSNKPLHECCGFLPYSRLSKLLGDVQSVVRHLKPDFIDDITEFYDPADEFEA